MRLPEETPTLGGITHAPRFLYKFRHFEEGGIHLDILRTNEVFFSSPSAFNDPFDCHMPADYSAGTTAMVRRSFESTLKQKHPDWSDHYIRAAAKQAFRAGHHNDRGLQRKVFADHVDKRLGVFCLSANVGSALNWAHYSRGHSGFCVGIRTAALVILSSYLLYGRNMLAPIASVNYQDEYPFIDRFKMNPREQFSIGLLTKSKEWEYEREFRLLLFERTNVSVPLPPQSIERVVLGARISPENKEQILALVREHQSQALVFQAEPHTNQFRFVFKPIPSER
jgi:hypothetical protein